MKQEIIQGDCLEVMRGFSDKQFDLVLTDPPYGVNYEYNQYQDTPENLKKLIDGFMPEVLRIGKRVMITCGNGNQHLYPKPDWLKKNHIPEAWSPMDETRRMKNKAELYICSAPMLSRVMGTEWTMPREQMWFWEVNYREHLASHTTKVWLAQMP